MTCHSRIRRRGASLMELMVVISLLTVVMMFVARMLYGLSQVEQSAMRDALLERRLADLAVQFREDVHRADAVTLAEQGARLECRGPRTPPVNYSIGRDGIERVERSSGPNVPRRDLYRLPGCRAEFRTSEHVAAELHVLRPLPMSTRATAPAVAGGSFLVQASPRRYLPTPDEKE